MEYRTLGNTGISVSALSMGASSLGGVFQAIDENEGIRAVHVALDAGVNHFDVAPAYGATVAETVLGRALQGLKVHMDQAKPLGAAARPLKVVEQAPGKVGVHRGALRARGSALLRRSASAADGMSRSCSPATTSARCLTARRRPRSAM